jgi:hypothetical protein
MAQSWLAKTEHRFRPCVVRLAHGGGALLVDAELRDEQVFTAATEDGQRLWELGDTFEMFLKPEGSAAYVELHVAPNNRRVQMRFEGLEDVAEARRTGSIVRFALPGRVFESNVEILVGCWRVRARLPLQGLFPDASAGGTWLVSFCRYDYSRGIPDPVLSSTSPHRELDFHRLGEWTRVRLEGS